MTVNPIVYHAFSDEICQGDVYVFGSRSLDSTDVYVDTLSSAKGCDSIVTLNLTVNPVYDITIAEQICEGNSTTFNGVTYTDAGIYVANLNTVNGCDSIVTLNLTVLSILETALEATICDGDSLDFNGQNLKTEGQYTHTTTSSIGCDSVVTMTLIVLPVNTETYADVICEGDVYDFNGMMLDTAGTYIDTLPGTNGCDSIVTLILTVNPVYYTEITEEICEGDVYIFHGTGLIESNIYVDTLKTELGCDSIVSLNLIVNPVFYEEVQATICEGKEFDFNGNMITAAGTYTDTLSTVSGCDSVRVLTLTVLPILRENLSIAICEGDTFEFGDLQLTESGSYVDSLISTIGCDSVVFLDLLVHEIQYSSDNVEICAGDTILFHGQILTTAGSYLDTLASSTGCDSIVSLDLIVHDVYNTMISHSICEGDTVNVAAKQYFTTGSFVDTLTSQFGCDSILHIEVEVREIRYAEISSTICNDIMYNFNGLELDQSGVYVDTLISSIGCDSIITLTLEVVPVKTHTFVKQVCTNQTYTFFGQVYAETGIYTDTTQATNGCDSIVTVDLRIVDVIEVDIADTICEGEIAVYNGISYDQTGDYLDTLTSVGGCDSVMHISLFVAPIERTSLSETICEGDIFDFHGEPLSLNGVYFKTLTSRFGCDSILELTLNIIPTVHTDLIESICEGDQYAVGDTSFDFTGNYDVTLISNTGCDSIVHLDLTVIPTSRHTDTVHICEGETFTFNNVVYDSTGLYLDTLVSAAGCDSLAMLDLRVHPMPFSTVMYSLCSGETVEIDGSTYDRDTTFDLIYTGAFGCDSLVTYQVTFLPDVALMASGAEICEGESIQLQVEVTGADSAFVTWSPAEGLSCTGLSRSYCSAITNYHLYR